MLVEVGKLTLALGVEWLLLSNGRETREAKSANNKKSIVLAAGPGNERWLGVYAPLRHTAYPGALVVAAVEKNVIFAHRVDESHTWVCLILQGMPVVGHDLILPRDAADNTVAEWAAQYSQVPLFAQGDQIRSLESVIGVLAERSGEAALRRSLKKIAIEPPGAAKLRAMRLAAVAGAVGAVGYFAPAWYDSLNKGVQSPKVEISLADVTSAQRKAREAQALEQKETQQRTVQVEIERIQSEYSSRLSPSSLWSEFTKATRSVPPVVRGFRPQAYECTEAGCDLTWTPVGAARLLDKQFLPNVRPSLDVDFAPVSHFDITAERSQVPVLDLPLEEVRFQLQARFAARFKSFVSHAPRPVAINTAPGSNGPQTKALDVGIWSLNLTGATAILDAAQFVSMLDHWPTRLRRIKYTPQTGAVEMDGDYVVLESKGKR